MAAVADQFEPVGETTDVFALGLICTELLTGRRPEMSRDYHGGWDLAAIEALEHR
ncbi:serine/threonine kinase [Candidatus Hydrogenisulfobacillus filiaventi]|uniref:Serine/threonine kinase n=1 Tax=Candidatus Hydrogenisulfobacillus filiaventi TaxID=2707344 RepID=A0A6F8ZDX2_9FIRM|nr:serine/threonine kinase [Candidatus Hydrogenisulfobacillus filiaventi]